MMYYNDIAIELARLHVMSGADFIAQLKKIVQMNIFKYVPGEKAILMAEGSHNGDMQALLDAAHKAVQHGNTVYILPNPQGIRTADFIFENKGIYKMYDLKTIAGKGSVSNRLKESVGQTNRVLLNITSDYNPIALARSIRKYFEKTPHAVEVLIYKRHKYISVLREDASSRYFFKNFIAKYIK
jgi:hypothetical protein